MALFETVGADHEHAHDITDAIALDGSADPLSFLPGMLASAPRVHPGEEVAWPLQSVYWANFFSERWKALIDGIVEKAKIGGLRRRDLRNGGLLLLTAESPQDPEEPESGRTWLPSESFSALETQEAASNVRICRPLSDSDARDVTEA